MSYLRYALLLALAYAIFAPAQAQVRFLPYVGYNLNAGYDIDGVIAEDPDQIDKTGGFLVGVGAEFALTPGILPVALKVRPSVETAFLAGDEERVSEGGFEGSVEVSQSFFQLSGDLIAELSPPLSPVIPYVGVGLTYTTYELEFSATGDFEEFSGDDGEGADGSAVGANILGGVRFGSGFIAPFAQARYSLADPSPDVAVDAGDEIGNGFSILVGLSIGL